MYRFLTRPKWILFTLLILGLVVLMVNLGFWQLRRLDERRNFNDTVTGHGAIPVLPVEQVLTPTTDPADVDWRRVTATGTYLADQQVVIVDRSQNGAAGVDVVTPLQLADGTLLLVDRGFVDGATRVPAPPSGTVTVTGRLRSSERHTFGAIDDSGPGPFTELHRVNVPLLTKQLLAATGKPTLPMYVDALYDDPNNVPQAVPDPKLDEGPHLSYAIQWFIFSVCAIVGWVLAVRRSARKRAQAAAAAASVPADPAGPLDTVDAPGADAAPADDVSAG